MKPAWLKEILLLSLAVVFNASAMTTADNASKAPVSKAVPSAGQGKIVPPAGVMVWSAQRAASEAQRAASEAQPAGPKK